MKLVKSLLLGSAAGIAAVSGAQAADLPVRKAAPVEYVRVCTAYGAGFFYIPGTDTCLRISGRVRAEYRWQDSETRVGDTLGWRARARLNLDARTATAYGTLRTFIRYELTRNSGVYGAVQQQASGGVAQNLTVDLNKAFIQFAGITAGRATSFFDFYANDLNWGGLPTGSDTYGNDPVVLAYTASFGAGWSATISLEDPASRRVTGAFFGPLVGPAGVVYPFIPQAHIYAGQRVPEVVANVRVDQAWGSAQLAGAIHQINSSNLIAPNPVGPLAGLPAVIPDTEYGFAISAGLKVNLPMIAPGDVLWLQGTYADGAVNYLGFGNAGTLRQGGQNPLVANLSDAYVAPNGDVDTVKGWNITAALLHYWTPQIRQSVFGTYGQLEVPGFATSAFVVAPGAPAGAPATVFPGSFAADFDYWQIGTNLIWSPVRDLDIGVEVLYRTIDPNRRVIDLTSAPIAPGVGVAAAPVFRTIDKDDAFEARLRIQRDF